MPARAFPTIAITALAATMALTSLPRAEVVVDLDGDRFPSDLMIVRRPYDEFHTVCPDRECMLVPDADGKTWFYANTSRVPLDIITYGDTVNRYEYYLDTGPDAPYYLGRPPAQMPEDKGLWFYCAQDGNRGTPNPQIRPGGWSGNRIWVNNRPGEGSLGDEPYRVDCGPMEWWSVFLWHRRDFVGGLSETDYEGAVIFDTQSTIELTLPGANDQYFRKFAADGYQNAWLRLIVRNGSQYYLSEKEYVDEYDQAVLSDFNDNVEPGKRWVPWNPTATEFDLPDPLPPATAVDFDDVREVGFYFKISKGECPHHDYTETNYSISSFKVSASPGAPVAVSKPKATVGSTPRGSAKGFVYYGLDGRMIPTGGNRTRATQPRIRQAGRTQVMFAVPDGRVDAKHSP
ncbi:MAG: hypothetical protein GF331_10160 [Chitinivibrionales bacterium]|nr:hypothetical protein [Chitinivibrionales bacterium]